MDILVLFVYSVEITYRNGEKYLHCRKMRHLVYVISACYFHYTVTIYARGYRSFLWFNHLVLCRCCNASSSRHVMDHRDR